LNWTSFSFLTSFPSFIFICIFWTKFGKHEIVFHFFVIFFVRKGKSDTWKWFAFVLSYFHRLSIFHRLSSLSLFLRWTWKKKKGETYDNADFYEAGYEYDLTGNVIPVQFVPGVNCTVLNPELHTNNISLVIWDFAITSEVNCVDFASIANQLSQNSVLVLFTPFSTTFENDFTQIFYEPFGDISSLTIPCTIISPNLAAMLNETFPLVHVTSRNFFFFLNLKFFIVFLTFFHYFCFCFLELSDYEAYTVSTALKAFSYFFACVYFIVLLYALVQLAILLFRRTFLHLKMALFILGAYVCLCKLLNFFFKTLCEKKKS